LYCRPDLRGEAAQVAEDGSGLVGGGLVGATEDHARPGLHSERGQAGDPPES